MNLFFSSYFRPNPRYAPIIDVIVTIPLVQIFALLMGIFAVAFEYPAPFLKGTVFERNFTFKAVYLLIQATIAVLFYQVIIFLSCAFLLVVVPWCLQSPDAMETEPLLFLRLKKRS